MSDEAQELDAEDEELEAPHEDVEPMLTFRVHGTLLGVPVRQVEEITDIGPVTDIPLSPTYLTGLMSWRGRPVPLLSLPDFAGLGATTGGEPAEVDEDRPERAIVTLADEMRVALRCDVVAGVIEVPRGLIESPRATESQPIAKYLEGEVDADDGLLLCLDLGKLLDSARLRE